jgi:hypothetical protein
MLSSLQAAITKANAGNELPGSIRGLEMETRQPLTVFRFLPVGLKAYFDLDRSNRHDLKSQ